MSGRVLRNAWEGLRDKAGLQGVHLADLRHEAGSRYSDADVPLAHVSKMLGYADFDHDTRYLNVTEEALRRAVKKLESSEFAKSLQCLEKAKVESDVTSNVRPANYFSTNKLELVRKRGFHRVDAG